MLRRFLTAALLLLAVACSPATNDNGDLSRLDIDPPGVQIAYPADWAVEEVDGGAIVATDAETVNALLENETINGAGLAVSTLPTSELAAADPLDLINVLLENFVTAGDAGWQLTGPPSELIINDVPAARLVLTRTTAEDPGVMSLVTVVGEMTTVLIVSIDTTSGGTHADALNGVVESVSLQ